jgi:hypothetical protein
MLLNNYMRQLKPRFMRFTVLVILLLASMHPMLAQPSLHDGGNPYFAEAGNVDVIQEI